MSSQERTIHLHPNPDRFVAGTIGTPGARVFYLQARTGDRLHTVRLEKLQVASIGEQVDLLLDEILRRTGGNPAIPAIAPVEGADTDPLTLPVDELFVVGAVGLAWLEEDSRLLVELQAVSDNDEDSPDIGDDDSPGPDTLRVTLTAAQARGFAKRATLLVAAGRPPCPFCAQPLDPEGHICVRQNGYRR